MPIPTLQLLVCTNERDPAAGRSSCAPAGGLAVYRTLKDLVKARGLKETVLVTRTGCLHHCSRGPTVAIWPGNRWYGAVAAEDVLDLLEAALAGREVERLRMPPGPWE